MYQSPTVTHGFNHQSLYRQPVSNLRQINDVVWDRNNETQQTNGVMSHVYPSVDNQQFVSESGNLQQQFYAPMKNPNEVKLHPNVIVINNHENNVLNYLPQTTMNGYSSTRQSRPTNTTSGTNQDRLLSRQFSLGAIPETKNVSSQEAVSLSNSRSAGTVNDYIQKERRSHTMAPITRISGPSTNVTTNMFASTIAPSDAQTMKSSHATETVHNPSINSYHQSTAQMSGGIDNNHTEHADEGDGDEEEDEEDDDDDDAPIIVKVQYDPTSGGPPSEDVIRQAVDNQLKGQSRPKNSNDPIVLNFLNRSTQPQIPSMPIRPQQPVFNRSAPSIPQLITRSQHQVSIPPQQQNLPSLQQRQNQQQLFLQKQHQQKLLFQQQQFRQQQLKQQQQLQLQEKQRQHQQQQQRRRQDEVLSQQQKQKQQLDQFLQQQFQLAQQRKQDDLQHLRRQLKAEQNEIQQLIQQQLQVERQQQQQQKYRQLTQQQQRQRQHKLQQQQNPQIHQSQQYATLPPTGPRPSRTIPTYQPPTKFIQHSHAYPAQLFPSAPVPLRNPQQISSINIQNLPNRIVNSASTTTSGLPGFNVYNSYSHQNIPNIFIPIQVKGSPEQHFSPLNNNNMFNIPPNLLQRPQTAPSSTEMFRPSSALDIPELSKESLSVMLDQIPGLQGRRFSIEYAEPADPAGYPIPSQLDGANAKYPEGVVVDQLPRNIIQHVKSSNNLELKAALDLPVQPEKPVRSTAQSGTNSSKLKKPSSKVLHHSARPKQRVKHSRPVLATISDDSDSNTETSTSDEETEIEEIEIEIIPLSKYQKFN